MQVHSLKSKLQLLLELIANAELRFQAHGRVEWLGRIGVVRAAPRCVCDHAYHGYR